MDREELLERILNVLKASSRKLQLRELRAALPQFADLPEDDWCAAIQDLHSDGMIEARLVRTGLYNAVRGAYNIEITPRGRALTPETDRLGESRHGAQTEAEPVTSTTAGFTDQDRKFARMAIDEARKSVPEEDGRPHPKVGVVVVKAGEVLALAHRGETPKCHAEYIVLEEKLSGISVAGATVYTTLEPCTKRNHPKLPCAHRLVERKVARVVIGMFDPNRDITTHGQQVLRDANIITDVFPPTLWARSKS